MAFCTQCGNRLSDNAKFCFCCGAKCAPPNESGFRTESPAASAPAAEPVRFEPMEPRNEKPAYAPVWSASPKQTPAAGPASREMPARKPMPSLSLAGAIVFIVPLVFLLTSLLIKGLFDSWWYGRENELWLVTLLFIGMVACDILSFIFSLIGLFKSIRIRKTAGIILSAVTLFLVFVLVEFYPAIVAWINSLFGGSFMGGSPL